MLGLAGIPSFILFVGFIFMPESPRWLIRTHQEERARRVLQTMRGQLDIEDEYESIKANCLEAQQNEDLSCKYMYIVLTFCDILQGLFSQKIEIHMQNSVKVFVSIGLY